MQIHKLTAKFVAGARPGKHEDGGGLRLVVSPAGAKKWVLRLTVQGKRRELGLGSYPKVTLTDARSLAAQMRQQASDGVELTTKKPVALTFTHAAAGYIRAHRRGWSNPKHARQWCATLKTYARPVIGETPVDQIDTGDILKVLTPIWSIKTETAKRVQGRMESVLDFAAAHRWRSEDNPARWRGHLDKLLAKPTRVRRPEHHPAMPYQEIPDLMRLLMQQTSVSSQALRFLILTACRSGEVLGARWQEIDTARAVWTVPASRMKSRREHRIPLAPETHDLLLQLPRLNEYLFPGARFGKSLSNMALLQLMRGMGYGVGGAHGDYVPHGFRSSFRDWASEQTDTPHAVMEAALAHVVSDKTVSAYARSDLFDRRRKLMCDWALFTTSCRSNGLS